LHGIRRSARKRQKNLSCTYGSIKKIKEERAAINKTVLTSVDIEIDSFIDDLLEIIDDTVEYIEDALDVSAYDYEGIDFSVTTCQHCEKEMFAI